VRDDDRVSAVALVVESEGATSASVAGAAADDEPVELSADAGEAEGPIDAGESADAASDGAGPADSDGRPA